MSQVIIVGAGINGVTAAIELKNRGHEVMLVDPGPLPHALAASTDISKAVRAAYGADEDYTAMAERSIKLWRQWNEEFGTMLYHEVGVTFVRRRRMERAPSAAHGSAAIVDPSSGLASRTSPCWRFSDRAALCGERSRS